MLWGPVRVWREGRGWLRAHPRVADAIGITPIFLLNTPFALRSPGHPSAVYVAVAFALCAPIAVRREWPRAVFAAVALTAFAQWVLSISLMPADLALFIAQYTVASRGGPLVGAASAVVMEVGAVLAAWRLAFGAWTQLIPYTVFVGATWILANSVRTRRAYLAGLVERAVRAERERDAKAQVAAAEERARIARELHDVIAHSVSVMVVQADGAAYAIDAEPARAKEALRAISGTGRQALAEMRRMLGVLRVGERDREALSGEPASESAWTAGLVGRSRSGREGGQDREAYAPQPGIDQLTELIARMRRSGVAVGLSVEGEPRPMSKGLELTAYRVAQEALTNTLKHAGPRASALVRLRYAGGSVAMSVADDGRGAAAAASDGAGHGLIGMRERVEMYGGTVRAGPRPGGGYEVVARLPLEDGPDGEGV